MPETAEIVTLRPDTELESAWAALAEAEQWGDGLPLLAPTVERVERFLHDAGVDLAEQFGPFPPQMVHTSAQTLAANAVMAGCSSALLPLLLAAVRAVVHPEFNLHGVLATTHPCTPLLLVNGPARRAVGLNCEGNCLGQGTRANATLGRALHLALVNVGGAVPGSMDRATHGTPAKLTYCFGENEEDSPWEPLHVRLGFPPEQSVVSLVAAEAPHNINDHGSDSGEGLLRTIAGTMSSAGSNTLYLGGTHLLVLGPEHAATLARDGWNPERVQQALFELSRVHVDRISPNNHDYFAANGKQRDGDYYTVGDQAEDLLVICAGGPGKHSLWIPAFGSSTLRCEPVDPGPGSNHDPEG